VAQDLVAQVLLAAIGVDQRAIFALRDGVDGEVAPGQVFFERDVPVGMDGEATLAGR